MISTQLLQEGNNYRSKAIPRCENTQTEGKIILSMLPLIHLNSQFQHSLCIALSPCIQAWVKTPHGYTPIPSHGIPQELRENPDIRLLQNASIKLIKDSKTKQYIGFSIRHRLFGGSITHKKHKNALEVCEDIGKSLEAAQFQNVLALARKLHDIPLKNVRSPDYLAEALLKSLAKPQSYSQNSSISQSARLITAKIANHYLIATLSKSQTCPFQLQIKQPFKILKNQFDNNLYIELKLAAYLLNLNPQYLQILGKRGKKLLSYVSNLNLSQTILEIHEENPNRNEPIHPPRHSKKTKQTFLGRYLILKTISQADPDEWTIDILVSFLENSKGWKTVYYGIEVALGWCLRDCDTVFKSCVVEKAIVPLTSFDRLHKKYNWRIREKAYNAYFLLQSFYFSITPTSEAKLTENIVKANTKAEKDIRVIKTLRNKQLTISRFNIGHMHWNYTPQQQKHNKLDLGSYLEGRENEIDYLIKVLAKIKTKKTIKTIKTKISVLGNAGIGKTALIAKTIQILIENRAIEQIYPDGAYYCDFSNRTDSQILFSKIGCDSYESLYRVKQLKFSLVVLDRTDCLSRPQIFRLLSIFKQSSIILASRRFSDLTDFNICLSPLSFFHSQNIFEKTLGYRVHEEFCKKLGGLPLAITQAANYIKSNTSRRNDYNSYKEFRDWIKKDCNSERELVSKQATDKQFTAGFCIMDSLKVLSERSLECLSILSSMNFEVASLEFIDPGLLRGLKDLIEYGFVIKSGHVYRLSHLMLYSFCSVNLETTSISRQFKYFTKLFRMSEKRIALYKHGMRLQAKACELGYYKWTMRLTESMRNFLRDRDLNLEHILMNEKALKAAEKQGVSKNKYYYNSLKAYYYQNKGQYSTAIHYYKKALGIHDCKNLEEIILPELALCYILIRETEKGVKTLKLFRKRIKETENKHAIGAYFYVKSCLSRIMRNNEKGTKCLIKALSIYKEFNDYHGQMTCLIELGHIFFDIGNLNESIKYYEDSLLISKDIENNVVNSKIILLNLGKVYLVTGEYERGVEYISSSFEYFKHSIYGEIKCTCYFLMSLAMALQTEYNKVKDYIYMAEEISRKMDYKYLRVQILQLICVVGFIKDDKDWDQYFEEALNIANEIKDVHGTLFLKFTIYSKYLQRGNIKDSIPILNEAKRELKLHPNPSLEAIVHIANAYMQFYVPDLYAMENSLLKSLEISQNYNYQHLKAIALSSLGYLYVTQGKTNQALNLLQESYDLCTRLNFKLVKLKSQALIGYYYQNIGNYQTAGEYLNATLEEALKYGDFNVIGIIRTYLVRQCLFTGKYNDALTHSNHSINYFRRFNSPLNEAYAIGLRGMIYFTFFDIEKGFADLNKSEEILKTMYPPNHPDFAMISFLKSSLGWAFSLS